MPTFCNKTEPICDRLLGESQFAQPQLHVPAASLGAPPPARIDLTLGQELDIKDSELLPISEEMAEMLDHALKNPISAASNVIVLSALFWHIYKTSCQRTVE